MTWNISLLQNQKVQKTTTSKLRYNQEIIRSNEKWEYEKFKKCYYNNLTECDLTHKSPHPKIHSSLPGFCPEAQMTSMDKQDKIKNNHLIYLVSYK